MRFTALKVSNGDSFLIEINEINDPNYLNILVDTGSNTDCIKELNSKEIKKLDFLFITHYHHDHVGGAIELIKSDIKITEIWLPDNFGRIDKTLEEDKIQILKLLLELEGIQPNNDNDVNTECEIIHPIFCIPSLCNNNYILLLKKDMYINKQKINLIKKLIIECSKKAGLTIKWLKYTEAYSDKEILPNMVGINCLENKKITSFKNELEAIYYLEKINHESLVLKFNNKEFPNVLFTADSGFEFMNDDDRLELVKNSIVTAPHHGSSDIENERVYDLITGDNLIYVRSENSSVSNITSKYKNQKVKYCTKCRNKEPISEIALKYNGGTWTVTNNKSTCVCI